MKRIIMVCILIISGCTSLTFQVVESTDKMNPGIITFDTTMPAVGREAFSTSGLTMYPFYFYNTIKDAGEFQLMFKFKGSGVWSFMESVRFLIDGDIYDYEPISRPKHDVLSGGSVREYMWIIVPEQFYIDIIESENVSMRVYGSNITHDEDFNETTIERLSNFYTTVKQKTTDHTNINSTE